ncbi:MAG TPA: large conductance mechanosensitive channel protein MscL [Ktedonobacteraceae bacterium]|jgi:large conductance mechanosensitive channel
MPTSGSNAGSQHNQEDSLFQEIGHVGKSALKGLGGFRAFLLRGNVVDLAIGIIIGAAFTAIVTAFVNDLLTPLIPLPSGKGLATASFIIPWTGGSFNYGHFLGAVISFLIVALILYFFVLQPVNALVKRYKPQEAEIRATRDCPYCLQAVQLKATRCPYCTSLLVTESAQTRENGPLLLLPETLDRLSAQLAEQVLHKATAHLQEGTPPPQQG